MADTAVAITAGTGTNIDTRTEATNGNHRQVVVIGDPATNAGVAPVDATTGLSVNVTNASLTVASHAVTNAGTFAVQAAATLAAETTKNIGTVRVGDGTNTAVVKAASTAPAAADPALVVTISPNSQNANGQATMANSTPVAIASDQSAIPVTPAGNVAHDAVDSGNPLKIGGYASAVAPTDVSANADRVAAWFLRNGAQTGAQIAHTAGGLDVFRSLDIDETEEDVKTSPGCLYKLRITNRTTSVRYVKLYNATAANVTVGTTTPLDTIPVPANASDYTVLTESFGGIGLTFSVALSIAATTGFADNDTGAPGTNDVIVSAYYK